MHVLHFIVKGGLVADNYEGTVGDNLPRGTNPLD